MKTFKGSRQHGFAAFLAALKYMKELLLPLVILVVSNGFRNGGEGWAFYWRFALGGALVLGAFGWGFLKWWWFRYKVEGGQLKVEEGVLIKKQQSIPLERIQTVDFSEGLLHRMFGLVRVQVQTAGGTKPEAVFAALSKAEADRLEQVLRAGRSKAHPEAAAVPPENSIYEAGVWDSKEGHSASPASEYGGETEPETSADEAQSRNSGESAAAWTRHGDFTASGGANANANANAFTSMSLTPDVNRFREAADDPPEVSFKLPVGRLFLAGLTVNNMGVGISLLFAGLSQADDIFPGFEMFEFLAESSGPRALLILGAAALLISWVLAVGSSVIRFGEFTVSKRGEELLITRGLLERRKVTLPVRRIQAVRITREVLWRPFGLAAVHVVCAGYGNQQGESTLLFPLMKLEAVEPFLQALCPEYAVDPEKAELQRVPRKAIRSYMLPLPIFLSSCTVLAVWLHPLGKWGIAAVAVTILLAWSSYRRAGYSLQGNLLLLRNRWITETLIIVPRRRIQYFTVNRNLFQRRSGLSSITVSLAAGMLGAHFGLKGLKAETSTELQLWSRRTKDIQHV
jgi:putative membrane protein